MIAEDTQVEELLAQAMALPVPARKQLLMRLVEALGDPGAPPPQPGEDRGESLGETLLRRIDQIDRGEVELVSWASVRDRLLRKHTHAD